MNELDYLIALHDLLTVIATFQIATFGWKIYNAFCGGWFRLDKYGGDSV